MCFELETRYINSEPLPLKKEIIKGLFRKGETVVVGLPAGKGQSVFLSNMAVSISTGGDFLGLPGNKSRVVYLNLNAGNFCDGSYFFQQRISVVMQKKYKLKVPPVEFFHFMTFSPHGKTVHDIAELIKQNTIPCAVDVIIIDPLYWALAGCDQQRLLAAYLVIEDLASVTGAAVVFAYAPDTYFDDYCDAYIHVKPVRIKRGYTCRTFYLEYKSRSYRDISMKVKMDFPLFKKAS